MVCQVLITLVWTLLILIIFESVNADPYTRHAEEWPKKTPDEKTGERVAQWNANMNMNPEELGSYFEGDIMLKRIKKRNGYVNEDLHWPNGVIPYVITGNFSNEQRNLIKAAINDYHLFTCVKFKPWTNEENYVNITSNNTGCWSVIGKTGGEQIVNLQIPSCVIKKGTIIHELMHVCGFIHEHTREDRDDYVDIIWDNIEKDYFENFAKAAPGVTTSYGVSYDYFSVLHYSAYAFANNTVMKTVVTKNPHAIIGQREGFSKSDIIKINRMYECDSTSIVPILINNGFLLAISLYFNWILLIKCFINMYYFVISL